MNLNQYIYPTLTILILVEEIILNMIISYMRVIKVTSTKDGVMGKNILPFLNLLELQKEEQRG